MNRREALKFGGIGLTLAVMPGFLVGCNQSTIAALTQEIGTLGAELATALGGAALGQQITTLTATAVADIQAWTPGSPAQDAIQALNDLSAAISQIPPLNADPTVSLLVTLALGTITGILTILQPSVKARVTIENPPADKKTFRSKWNALAAQSSNPFVRSVVR